MLKSQSYDSVHCMGSGQAEGEGAVDQEEAGHQQHVRRPQL